MNIAAGEKDAEDGDDKREVEEEGRKDKEGSNGCGTEAASRNLNCHHKSDCNVVMAPPFFLTPYMW